MSEKPFKQQKIPSFMMALMGYLWIVCFGECMLLGMLDPGLITEVGVYLLGPALIITVIVFFMSFFDWSAFDDI